MLLKLINKHFKYSGLSSLLLMLVFFLSGCGGGGSSSDGYTPPPPPPDPPPPTTYMNAPTSMSSSVGELFVNSDNITLYTFENDRTDSDSDGTGDSDCNSSCATTWPPMLAPSNAQASGDFTIITRDNSSTLQWAFKGLALYMYVNDTASGDINGEGINDVWFVARPDPVEFEASMSNSIGTIAVSTFTQINTDGSGGIGSDRLDREGYTLYTFENDRNDTDGDGMGDSDCNSNCAEIWPPLYADKGATAIGDYTIISRDDGTSQWALNGLPLYFFANDTSAGETNGEAINNIWYVARPTPFTSAESSLGGILSTSTTVYDVDVTGAIDTSMRKYEGFSLYVFDNDMNDTDDDGIGDSDCNGGCAVTWPPFYADFGAVAKGEYSVVIRDDGSRQWAYKNEPLYFFVNDLASGDVNGDQVGSKWHLARTAPLQFFTDDNTGLILAARGLINDVDDNGNQASTSSDKTGYTVYLFDDDASDTDGDGVGDSDCNDSCAVTWPPVYAMITDIESPDLTIITRDDGSLQWAYKGVPLYFFIGDSTPAATSGIYGTWHEVSP